MRLQFPADHMLPSKQQVLFHARRYAQSLTLADVRTSDMQKVIYICFPSAKLAAKVGFPPPINFRTRDSGVFLLCGVVSGTIFTVPSLRKQSHGSLSECSPSTHCSPCHCAPTFLRANSTDRMLH